MPLTAEPPIDRAVAGDQSAGADAPADTPAVVAPRRGHLVLTGIGKNFAGSNIPALVDVTLQCAPGEFLVVVGPSGSGKSTLLSIAAGMLRPDAGTVMLDGRRTNGPGPDRAVVFQDHGLFPWLTASQNIEFGLKMAGVSKAERRDRARQALHMVHLDASAGKLIHELSGGMRQRIAIARALVMDPSVLLMDEPFAALDAQTRTLMHEQLQELWGKTQKSILFVTHSVGEAVRLADRIIVLHANPGRIRKEIRVGLPHPRNFDSRDVSELVHQVRKEIEDEVNRVNAQMAEFWKPQTPEPLGAGPVDLGGGI